MDTLVLAKCLQQRTVLASALSKEFPDYQRLTGLYLGGGLTTSEFLFGMEQILEKIESEDTKNSLVASHNEFIMRLLSLAASSFHNTRVDDEPIALVDGNCENFTIEPKLACGMYPLSAIQESEILESLKQKFNGYNGHRKHSHSNRSLLETIPTCFETGLVPNGQYIASRFKECAETRGISTENLNTSEIWGVFEHLLLKHCRAKETR